jgi:hypothetical protein
MKLYKVWYKRDEIIYCVDAESVDDALAKVRKIDPRVNTVQRCEDEEAHLIKPGYY